MTLGIISNLINKKSMMNKIWFIGLPYSVPIGVTLAAIVGVIHRKLFLIMQFGFKHSAFSSLYHPLTQFLPEMILVFFGVVALFFSINLKRYYIDRQTEFRPLRSHYVGSKSDDKRKAQNRPISKEYLSWEPSGLTVGRYRGRFVALPFLNSPEHQLILGAPGSRKSSLLTNALIYNYNFASEDEQLHAVFCIDVKPELSRLSVEEDRSDIKIVDPAAAERYGFDVFYGLTQSDNDDILLDRFEMISRTIIINPGSDGSNDFFYIASQQVMTAALAYGFRKGYDFNDSVALLRSIPTADLVVQIREDPDMTAHSKITDLVAPYVGKESDAYEDIEMTLQQELPVFSRDTVRKCFASDNPRKASPEDLACGTSIFLAIEDTKLKSYRPVFRLITQLCLQHIISVPEFTRPWKRPIWFLIDEAGSIGPVPDLIESLARGRSKGVQISLIGQAYSQFEDTYSPIGARSIKQSCKTTLVLSCSDGSTAKELSERAGDYRETKISQHKGDGRSFLNKTTATNETLEYRPSISVADIDRLEYENKVLVFAKGEWFLVEKMTYKDIPEFERKSGEIMQRNARYYSMSTVGVSDRPNESGVRELMRILQEDDFSNNH